MNLRKTGQEEMFCRTLMIGVGRSFFVLFSSFSFLLLDPTVSTSNTLHHTSLHGIRIATWQAPVHLAYSLGPIAYCN